MLKREQYFKAVRRPYPPFLCTTIYAGSSNEKYFATFLSRPYAFKNTVVSEYCWYYAINEIEEMGSRILETWSDPEKFNEIKNLFKQRELNLLDSTTSNLDAFCLAYEEYMPALMLIAYADKPVANKMKELLQAKLSVEETEELMNELNIPLEDNLYKIEEYDLVCADDLSEHVKKYEWFSSRYGEEVAYTLEDANKRLHELKTDKESYLKKYEEEKQMVRNTIAKAKAILGKDAHFVDIMQYIIYYRTQRTDIMNKATYLFIPTLKQEAAKRNLSYKQLLFCTEKEALGHDPIPSIDLIEQRMKDHAILMEDGVVKCVTGEESQKIKEVLKEENTNVKEFNGSVACKGVVKGTVRIILSPDDYKRVNEGDILVTSMTTPNMVPIMQRSSAFVTDEGGITCHAAIISREMRKPCIIGTGIATQVLKDGDVIEVNADKGIVTILK